ncbi:RES family NAD+ phosphorylase [Paenibacillus filicis]|uniref:RES family NAD+ phosphorylase n=1 Tax=Paenibacillus gyeongsangnamensis TaxID=3388067 RepID=A0ABT4QAJ2_9BACL|nr:RES family NAD+ phosphorylase [Paenibacillus filicis]MCZ8513700.1 RES family NAD+ phosphorylase [Paenibacillus filicis]
MQKKLRMHAPEVGLSSGGRFHHPGQSVLYIAVEQLAMVETLNNPDKSTLIWVQTYNQATGIPNVLDLRHDWDNIGQTNSEVM